MKLNKKGFTLVELLAVIVILALLIFVVANTALPAMQNTKKSALETYAKRVVEQAKTLYMTDNSVCSSTCGLADIMGEDNEQYDAEITISTESGVIKVEGTVSDEKNSLEATIEDSKVTNVGEKSDDTDPDQNGDDTDPDQNGDDTDPDQNGDDTDLD